VLKSFQEISYRRIFCFDQTGFIDEGKKEPKIQIFFELEFISDKSIPQKNRSLLQGVFQRETRSSWETISVDRFDFSDDGFFEQISN